MILKSKEDFETAILNGEEIKHKIVFYTGEIEEKEPEKPLYDIGSYDARYGIYAGMCNHKQIWLALKNAPEEKTWGDAKAYCDGNTYLPTKEELMLIYVNKDIINQALIKAGGEPMKDDCYWSSSKKSDNCFWGLKLSSGAIGIFDSQVTLYVRPVLTL